MYRELVYRSFLLTQYVCAQHSFRVHLLKFAIFQKALKLVFSQGARPPKFPGGASPYALCNMESLNQ